MRQASKRIPESAEKTVRDIRRATRRHHSAEEKIRIVLEGLRGEDSIAELCRKEGINQNLYYRWSKEFLGAGKKRLAGDTAREATSDEVKELKPEARQLKETANHMRVVRGMFMRFGVCVVPVPEEYRLPISDLAVLHQQWDRGPQVAREQRR
jgi:transposase